MTLASTPDKSSPEQAPCDHGRPVYLDCNATTPVEPAVAEEVLKWTAEEFGNAGSRTHSYGQAAKSRVKEAREQVASVVDAAPDEVIFTSGATESNNLAILGLAQYGDSSGRRHIVTTQIEHKAVLEPARWLANRGFEVTELSPERGGWVRADALEQALRPDTLLVSIMAVNNETGVIQSIDEHAEVLASHEAFFHVDAAQGFGKTIGLLRNPRIDLLSISGHKIYAAKGIGALVTRRRRFKRPHLEPLMFGGGQERGLRPGTLPVALIAGLGTAAAMANRDQVQRNRRCMEIRSDALAALEPIGIVTNGALDRTIANTLNVSVPGIDSEAAIVALKDVVAISNGSACTSQSYEPSHVLSAAQLPHSQVSGALRLSWSHMTEKVDWSVVAQRLADLATT
ncbi:cysteine desulfurase DndA [Mycolicibacterium porcinum]|uniref:cysteine desulfurase DndA n=1 Tax=Mycolicibacterium porcinum TaxID=39693 RepID=UPI00080BCB5D|nr:cysteine desulfurase DndA [Mycolicibacterium porcinum]OCB14188.1 cysteine desulfurase DndA [Mycolicibacterium porcinum]